MQKPTIIKQLSCWLFKMVSKPSNLALIQHFLKSSPISYASGNYEVIDELLKNGADINVPDETDRTLLDLATQQSNYLKRRKSN